MSPPPAPPPAGTNAATDAVAIATATAACRGAVDAVAADCLRPHAVVLAATAAVACPSPAVASTIASRATAATVAAATAADAAAAACHAAAAAVSAVAVAATVAIAAVAAVAARAPAAAIAAVHRRIAAVRRHRRADAATCRDDAAVFAVAIAALSPLLPLAEAPWPPSPPVVPPHAVILAGRRHCRRLPSSLLWRAGARRCADTAAVQVRVLLPRDSNAPRHASVSPPLAAQPSFRAHIPHVHARASQVGQPYFFPARWLVSGNEACRRVLRARALRTRRRAPSPASICLGTPNILTLNPPHV